jgi:putative membrane protein
VKAKAMPDHEEAAPSASTQLAVERTLLAHERTLMAWVRTAASLISFGFTIYKFFEGMRQTGQIKGGTHLLGSRNFAFLMISIGLIALIMASIQHLRDAKKLKMQYQIQFRSVALWVAILIALLGAVGLLAVIFNQ